MSSMTMGPVPVSPSGTMNSRSIPNFAPLPTERRFVKTVCSAFKKESGLLEYLTEKGEKDVMVCGIMTDFCINATVEAGL